MIVVMQHVLIFTFLVLLKSAEHLSDAYGFKASRTIPTSSHPPHPPGRWSNSQ